MKHLDIQEFKLLLLNLKKKNEEKNRAEHVFLGSWSYRIYICEDVMNSGVVGGKKKKKQRRGI